MSMYHYYSFTVTVLVLQQEEQLMLDQTTAQIYTDMTRSHEWGRKSIFITFEILMQRLTTQIAVKLGT